MAYGLYETWYDKVASQYDEGDTEIVSECDSCGNDIILELNCLGAVQFYDVPDGYGEKLRICGKCFNSWIESPTFKEEFRKLCEVKNENIVKELLRV